MIKERKSGFIYLNITQFLGALNDNLYKLLLIFFLIDLQGVDKNSVILSLAGAIFVIPFLLFSIPSGTLADRMSKSKIIVFTKFLEVITISIGITGFWLKSPFLLYTGLFLLATQSAIFGPPKYGIIPEIVPRDKISRTNGYLSSFTFLAIIIGTFLGSFLTQITHRNFLLASSICLLIALIGVVSSFKIPVTPAIGSKKKIDPFFIREILPVLKRAQETKHLLPAIFGSGYFLFIGAFTQLNVIPYTIHCLGLSDLEGGYLFLVTALGIGAGSLIAGKISGNTVELSLVPIGAFGMSACFLVLGFCSGSLLLSIIAMLFIGVFGGLFLVPCDSYIQFASPDDARGQNVATNNFGGFVGVLIASGLIYLLSEILGLSANMGFVILGFLTIGIGCIFSSCFFQRLLHFFNTISGK